MIPLGAWPHTVAQRIQQDLEFAPVAVGVFFCLCAAWLKLSLPAGRIGRRRWRALLRLGGAAGVFAMALLTWIERGALLTASARAPITVGVPLAAEWAGSVLLAIFPWRWGSEDDAPTPPLGIGLDLAQQQPPAPKRGGSARARALLANAYAWLIVAAVAYIGIRWVLRHL
jgi:hypothetical protein